jgi:hypothetical protein
MNFILIITVCLTIWASSTILFIIYHLIKKKYARPKQFKKNSTIFN